MMGEQSSPGNGHDPPLVRKTLDEVLAKEITSLLDIDSTTALEAYNLTTLACIVVAVDREREIVDFSDSPPERYTRPSFIADLFEMGINSKDELDHDLTAVIDMGYLSINTAGTLQAEASACTMVSLLNTMFPGMQGMNLVAFVMQMNDEVVSGRKSLEMAKQSLSQTLKSRGLAINREKAEAAVRSVQTPGGGINKSSVLPASPVNRAVSSQLKENASKRIASLRSRRLSSKPAVYSSIGHDSERSTVKDVFDKEPSEAAIAAEQERQRAEQTTREFAEIQTRLREAEERSRQLEAREKDLKQAEDAARDVEQRIQKRVADEAAAMAEKEAELQARADEIKAAEQRIRLEKEAMEKAVLDRQRDGAQKPESEPEPEPDLVDEADLASRIAAFEAELAMPCPICLDGKIVSETTSKNKTYYTCSNRACRFVSWEKPYHFECPLCKNPFLTEFTTPSGDKGLKCPRASCTYSQNNLLDPRQNQAAEARPVKKKKKLVRRVKRRL
ncbi:multiple domain fusion protein (Zn-finger domain associated with topoisomerase type I/adhesin of Type V secretory pathway) [Desulforapulum autotrophicum HRM2]|uniref:Multiple domain fusion protein (Zn-finger domain associated with topoisomerase type I/adhesin of Type V secretory pathway) n=1 Tax=Desulforapulum autotrophicum (strain ATCC 43914 / DSM 3382 / VKM B-1955 / HRM2) TaxID=177437 RepID=C0QM75_DESAH|nr:multiple domain fusion protein (Zn-finger domain associated with topoisomerase type I/adhesin of Type V secretory pathway) [Desulforapulum autotrophicum]ACN16392.1 multiple domain fusion protein (Zn-finger domain associated with topoisomerase type I/adhesin of Type V secretory pathway) [Desulforapulum autotrophicum HRM2]